MATPETKEDKIMKSSQASEKKLNTNNKEKEFNKISNQVFIRIIKFVDQKVLSSNSLIPSVKGAIYNKFYPKIVDEIILSDAVQKLFVGFSNYEYQIGKQFSYFPNSLKASSINFGEELTTNQYIASIQYQYDQAPENITFNNFNNHPQEIYNHLRLALNNLIILNYFKNECYSAKFLPNFANFQSFKENKSVNLKEAVQYEIKSEISLIFGYGIEYAAPEIFNKQDSKPIDLFDFTIEIYIFGIFILHLFDHFSIQKLRNYFSSLTNYTEKDHQKLKDLSKQIHFDNTEYEQFGIILQQIASCSIEFIPSKRLSISRLVEMFEELEIIYNSNQKQPFLYSNPLIPLINELQSSNSDFDAEKSNAMFQNICHQMMTVRNESNINFDSKEGSQFLRNKIKESIAKMDELKPNNKAKSQKEIEENEQKNNPIIEYSKEKVQYFGKDNFENNMSIVATNFMTSEYKKIKQNAINEASQKSDIQKSKPLKDLNLSLIYELGKNFLVDKKISDLLFESLNLNFIKFNLGLNELTLISEAMKLNSKYSSLIISQVVNGEFQGLTLGVKIQGIETLSQGIENNPEIVSLCIASKDEKFKMGITGVKLLVLALKLNKSLKHLDLGGNHIGDIGAKYLLNYLINLLEFTHLVLFENKLTNNFDHKDFSRIISLQNLDLGPII